MSTLQDILQAGDALIVHLDYPPDEAKEAQKEAARAIKDWRRVSDAAKRRLGLS